MTPPGPESGMPAAARRSRRTISAMAERQMLPVHTMTTRYGPAPRRPGSAAGAVEEAEEAEAAAVVSVLASEEFTSRALCTPRSPVH